MIHVIFYKCDNFSDLLFARFTIGVVKGHFENILATK